MIFDKIRIRVEELERRGGGTDYMVGIKNLPDDKGVALWQPKVVIFHDDNAIIEGNARGHSVCCQAVGFKKSWVDCISGSLGEYLEESAPDAQRNIRQRSRIWLLNTMMPLSE